MLKACLSGDHVGSGEKKNCDGTLPLKGRKGCNSSLLEGRGLGRLPMPRRAGKVEEAKPTSMADAQMTEASSSSLVSLVVLVVQNDGKQR